jgi:hypothetical protein
VSGSLHPASRPEIDGRYGNSTCPGNVATKLGHAKIQVEHTTPCMHAFRRRWQDNEAGPGLRAGLPARLRDSPISLRAKAARTLHSQFDQAVFMQGMQDFSALACPLVGIVRQAATEYSVHHTFRAPETTLCESMKQARSQSILLLTVEANHLRFSFYRPVVSGPYLPLYSGGEQACGPSHRLRSFSSGRIHKAQGWVRVNRAQPSDSRQIRPCHGGLGSEGNPTLMIYLAEADLLRESEPSGQITARTVGLLRWARFPRDG